MVGSLGRGKANHYPYVHDASLRVPLILSGLGIEPGIDQGVATLADVPPTVLGLLGVEAPDVDGRDLSGRLKHPERRTEPGPRVVVAESGSALSPAMTGVMSAGRADGRYCIHDSGYSMCMGTDAGVQWFNHVTDPNLKTALDAVPADMAQRLKTIQSTWRPEETRERTARDHRFKLVQLPHPEGGYRNQLFDLAGDPAEGRDVMGEYPEIAAKLSSAIDDWVSLLDDSHDHSPLRSRKEIEALRALGYLSAGTENNEDLPKSP